MARVNYNYNVYSSRCKDKDYSLDDCVLYARKNGISSLGLLEKAPLSKYDYELLDESTTKEEFFDFLEKVKSLKVKYSDIDIYSGIITGYKSDKSKYLISLREKVDYIIYKPSKEDKELKSPIAYAKEVTKALDTGLFDIITDVDKFLLIKDRLPIEERESFQREAIEASRMICSKARELVIPIEIDLDDFDRNSVFWNVCKSLGNFVILKNAINTPEDLDRIAYLENMYSAKLSGFNIVRNYRPFISTEREELLNKTKTEALTEEAYKSLLLVNSSLPSPSEDLSLDEIYDRVSSSLMEKEKEFEENYKAAVNLLEGKYSDVNNLSFKLIERIKNALSSYKIILSNNKGLLNEIIGIVRILQKAGCKSKDDLISSVSNLIEIKYTDDLYKKDKLELEMEIVLKGFEEGKKQETTGEVTMLVKTNPLFASNASKDSEKFWMANGFTTALFIGLILTFIAGFGIGMAYVLIGL